MDILITNDDGPGSRGLTLLAETLADAGHRVRIVCPAQQRSGVGMQLTIYDPLAAEPREFGDRRIAGYIVYGSPADCVKLALRALYGGTTPMHTDFKPELVVSGINPGANASVNVLYSGTVAAGLEALICDIPAVAVSIDLEDHAVNPVSSRLIEDFRYAARFASAVVSSSLPTLRRTAGSHCRLININVPYDADTRARGVKCCRQGFSRFNDWYEPRPPRPDGALRFQLTGILEHDQSQDEPDDATLLSDGWITLTVLDTNLTAADQDAVLCGLMARPLFPLGDVY